MNIDQAAARVSVEPSEVRSVTPHEHGEIIETIDGVQIIDIAEDTPDADGKTGLAFYVRPDGRDIDDPAAPTYAFPVFRPFAAAADDESTGDETGEPDLEGLTVKELHTLAEERGVDLDGATKKAEIIDVLRAAADDESTGDETGEHVTEPAPAP